MGIPLSLGKRVRRGRQGQREAEPAKAGTTHAR